MYVKQKYKFIFSFIFIFIFMFFACTVPYLETTVNAEVVTLTVGAAYTIMGAIAAGVVFTDPQGVIDYSREMNDRLLPLPKETYDEMHRQVEEKLKEWRDEWEDGKPPPRPPKPQKPLKPGGRFIPIIAGAQLPGWGKGILDYWKNKNDNQSLVVENVTIDTPGGKLVLGYDYISSSPKELRFVPYYIWQGIKYQPYSSVPVNGTTIDEISRYRGGFNTYYQDNYIMIKVTKYLDGVLYDEQRISNAIYIGTHGETNNKVVEVKPTIIKVYPPGTKIEKPLPQEMPELDDFKYPIPFPQIPQIPNPDWSDYGLGTEIVTIPQPGVSPDISTSPSSVPIQIPTKYPNDINILDLDSGITPQELTNLDKAGLNQYLQNNIYNNTTNNTIINNPGNNIEDGPYDIVDFDFSPLKNIGTALVTRFPFCIPFDLINSIGVIAGKSEPPKFDIEIKVFDILRRKSDSAKIPINFKDFETFAFISRIFCTLIFVVALMFITSKTIKW